MRCVPVLKRILIFVHTSVHDLLLLASSRAGFLHFWLSIDALCHFSHFTNGHIPGVLTLRPGGNGAGPGVEFIRTGTAPQSLLLAARVEIAARNRYSSILMAVGLRLWSIGHWRRSPPFHLIVFCRQLDNSLLRLLIGHGRYLLLDKRFAKMLIELANAGFLLLGDLCLVMLLV